jgi:chromosome partitioning protein
MIIGVLNQKAGVGKTTIAVNVAAVLAKAGNRVLLVDADPQGSALAWSAVREVEPIFPVVGMPTPRLHRGLPDVARDYDHVVIDGASRVSELSRAAIMASDVVVVPVQPSPYDVLASADVAGLIREAQAFKEAPRAAFALNRKIVNTTIGRNVAGALAVFGFQVLDVALHQRVIYAESAAQGLSVIEAAPASEAAREVALLAKAIVGPLAQWAVA